MEHEKPSLFRDEAIAHRRAQLERADLLAIDPNATAWGMRVIGLAALVSVLFLYFGRVNEYASGPAIVRLQGRTTLSARLAGVVARVDAVPGREVEQGDVLVQLHAADELAELEAARRELDHQLRKLLAEPDDRTAREALVSLRARKELAETRLAQRTVRAPHRGTIGDVRVREGQVVEPGATLAELLEAQSSASVSALLPGRYRPLLAKGHKLRFRLDGFHRQVLELTVTQVGDQIIGPKEAARYLGPDLADAFTIAGPVVLVEAHLPQRSFRTDGIAYEYAHGMLGMAEAVVRNERVAYALLPILKPWDSEASAPERTEAPAVSWLDNAKGLLHRAW
jgi:biotin carboxyl carrier protein